MSENARLTFEDKQVELPVVRGSEGEIALDISKLRGQTGLITLDRGFKNTGSTKKFDYHIFIALLSQNILQSHQ